MLRLPPRADGGIEVAVVLLLDDPVLNWIRRFQLGMENKYGANPALPTTPHVTLKLGVPVQDLEALAALVDRVAAESRPIQLEAEGIDFFDDGIVFLAVSAGPELESLRQRVLDVLRREMGIVGYPLEEAGRFRYHVTLARDLARGRFEEVRATLDRRTPAFRIHADRLALLCWVRDSWVTCHRVELGPGAGTRGG
ncbi:MAG TPA: 2'-5' RNA ligase family protein [Anaeromyxobacteraceae bacterium]|nr:2'-5' RNA ligase family protein [Anaeromyxobacteraceae bacterium]